MASDKVSENTTENTTDTPKFYCAEGYAVQILYPMKPEMLDYAGILFRELYDTYLAGKTGNIYFSIIPDKNYFLGEKYGYPTMDYSEFVRILREQTGHMTYIDLFDVLTLDDYYRTDLHYRQDALLPTAKFLASAMGVTLTADYTVMTAEMPFIGRDSASAEPKPEPDTLCYLVNNAQKQYRVYSYATGERAEGILYDLEKADGDDPYALFLSGSDPIQIIQNPNAKTDKELIVFRDSFGSAIAPLLAEAYREITLIDLRYVRANVLGQYVAFDGQDVLFLYSTYLLNNSKIMR